MTIHELKSKIDAPAINVALSAVPKEQRTEKVIWAVITAYLGGGADIKKDPDTINKAIKIFFQYCAE